MKSIILLAAVFCCPAVFAENTLVKPVASISKPLPPTAFEFVRGHKQGKNVAITWGMNNNAEVTHFTVECTYEDPYDIFSVWRTVGVIPCTPRTPIFKLIDSPVLPGTLNYRIKAHLVNNSTIISEMYTTYIQ